MALNGFNLPLAFTGQEIVWQQLWKDYGVSDSGLQEYFTGPAFLTWQRMANIRAFAGPLSDNWIEKQADLQKNILSRYSDLGMTPVLPAFNGVVPAEMAKLFPQANITQLGSWNNFPANESCNFILAATDPLFLEVGQRFLEKQVQIFGETANSHIYNCDTFNENKPASSDPDYLSSSSQAVYQSMIAADPDAVWLMQGWLFVNDREFWTDENIKHYLSGAPDSGMIVLDLSSEDLPVWDKISSNGKQFIWCMLHNYGGSRALYGDLSLLSTDPISVQKTVPEFFLGTGLTMEAIDHNPVVYEFMSEMAFHRSAPNVSQWIADYATRRYGLNAGEITPEQKKLALVAWEGLFANNYHGESPVCHHPCLRRSIVTLRPTWEMTQTKTMRATPLVDIWTALLYTNISSGNNAYSYDLVDVGRQVMTNFFLDCYEIAQSAFQKNDLNSFLAISNEMLVLIKDWDKLLASHQSFLLGKWIASARAWAKDAQEADLFDWNARNQLTLWGRNGEIDDYSAKNWAGLAAGYYLKRWQLLVTSSVVALKNKTPIDMNEYNEKELSLGQDFCEDYSTVYPADKTGDSVTVSHEMHNKYGNGYQSQHFYILQKNKNIVGFDVVPTPCWSKNLKQMQRLCDAAYYCVGFTTEGLLKTNSENMVDAEGIHTFLKGKCSSEKCGN
jgi:alpha-N-acetylglucosaminidase